MPTFIQQHSPQEVTALFGQLSLAEQNKLFLQLKQTVSQEANQNKGHSKPQKRIFGQFAGKATATFADDWSINENEFCQ